MHREEKETSTAEKGGKKQKKIPNFSLTVSSRGKKLIHLQNKMQYFFFLFLIRVFRAIMHFSPTSGLARRTILKPQLGGNQPKPNKPSMVAYRLPRAKTCTFAVISGAECNTISPSLVMLRSFFFLRIRRFTLKRAPDVHLQLFGSLFIARPITLSKLEGSKRIWKAAPKNFVFAKK